VRRQNCFVALSPWLIPWAGLVRFADVKFPVCDPKALPVTLHESSEGWWFWWVPLSNIGGKPFTYFNFSIRGDGAKRRALVTTAGSDADATTKFIA